MKRSIQMVAVAAVVFLAAGCEKSPEDLEKERQETIIREEMVRQIEDGNEFQEASKRPSALKPGMHMGSEADTEDDSRSEQEAN